MRSKYVLLIAERIERIAVMTKPTPHWSRLSRSVVVIVTTLMVAGSMLLGTPQAFAAEPTCSDALGTVTHGQHIIGDYVTGIGHPNLAWPPSGAVGDAVKGEGAAVPGGPGPGFHFPNGVAPGASFCNSQAQSPGFHVP